jgi:acyl-CoA dehydrogenase
MQMELFDTFDRLLSQVCTPAHVRALNTVTPDASIWGSLESSGFLDILVPEEAGGAGLGWQDAWPVLFASGRHGLPLPFAQTMLARACLTAVGHSLPAGPISTAGFGIKTAQGGLRAPSVCGALLADHVLVQHGATLYLLPTSKAQKDLTAGPGSLDASLQWDASVFESSKLGELPVATVLNATAVALAALMAGASDRVLEMTLNYANDRVQFGKPIGRLQAVQQQITEMAEKVYSARMASQLGCQSPDWHVSALSAALAKTQCSVVANRIASIAHATHGAIGVTYEYDLQLYTRRLYEWSRSAGGSQFWAQQLGSEALKQSHTLDFVRHAFF